MKLCVIIAFFVCCTVNAEIISASRRITWQGNVGVSNGVPSSASKTIYSTLAAGATLASVQSAIDNCPANQVVQLSSGDYSFANRLEFIGSNAGIVLRGTTNASGVPTTKITFTDAPTACILITSSSGYTGLDTDADLSENAVKGESTLTLTSVPAWVTVGDLIAVDQLDEAAFVSATGTEGGDGYRSLEGQGARNMGQINRVVSKTATTITLELPNYYGWKTAQTAQIFAPGYNPSSAEPAIGIGFEDIHFDATFNHQAVHFFKVENGDSCYWKNCFVENCPGGSFIWTFFCFRLQVDHCHFKDSYHLTGGSGYGTAWYHVTSACLVQNTIFELLHNAMTTDYGSSGNVWAYNYELSGQSDSGQNPSMNTHGVHCYMNLWEGNFCEDKMLADWTHGSSSHNTMFRNRVTGENGVNTSDERTAVSVEYYNRYWNVVGNILGITGKQDKRAVYSTSTSEGSLGNVYKFGGEVNINGDFSPADVYSYTSGMFILDHGNYDIVTDGQVWEASVSDHDIPSSLVFSEKPSWFGTLTWPPFDASNPSVASVDDIPAGYRYINGEDPPSAYQQRGSIAGKATISGKGSF